MSLVLTDNTGRQMIRRKKTETYHIKADTMDRRKNLGLMENVHKIEDWVLILPPL